MNSAQSCAAAGRVDHVRSGCSSSLVVVIAMASGGPTRRRTAAAATPTAFQCPRRARCPRARSGRAADRPQRVLHLGRWVDQLQLADTVVTSDDTGHGLARRQAVTASPATARRSLTVDEVRRHTDRQCGCRSTLTAIAAITPHSDSLIWHLMRAVTRAPICVEAFVPLLRFPLYRALIGRPFDTGAGTAFRAATLFRESLARPLPATGWT